MPKAEPARDVGAADEIDPQELVERVHRRSLGCPGRGGRQLGLEGIARHRRAVEHETRTVRQRRELLAQCCDDGRRGLDAGQ
jgi:hypothetical protein